MSSLQRTGAATEQADTAAWQLLALALAAHAGRLAGEAEGFERTARESRALFDVLAGELPVGIALYDLDLRHRFVNDAFATMHGVALQEHIGRRPAELPAAIGVEVERHLRTVLDSGTSLAEVQTSSELPRRPGVDAHHLRSYFPIRAPDGTLSGIGATVVDITERASAAAAAREQRDLYEALLRAQSELGEAVVVLRGLKVVLTNDAASRLLGRTPAEIEALPSLLDVIAPEGRRTAATRIEGVVAGHVPEKPGFRTLVERPDGTHVPVEAAGKALHGDGEGRAIIIARDISEQVAREQERERLLGVEQAARRTSEAAHGRMRLLADASVLLERSLEHDEPLAQLADLLAGRLADACAIELLDPSGRLRTAGRADRFATGLAVEPDIAAEVLAAGQARILDHGVALVPLVTRGRSVGLLTLGWADPAHRSPRDEWTLVEAVAQRLALAIDSAQQYREREHVSRTLQASLLADDLPDVPGVKLAAEYRPAMLGTDVGGDLYDAFGIGDDAWALVIGDVCGKGAEAAAITALARYTLRALAPRVASPAGTLAILNDELLRQRGGQRFITAALIRLEPQPGGDVRLTAASGGHPPPLVLRAGGGADILDCTGMLLGVEPSARSVDCHADLAAGDTLVLYTDGVTEASRESQLGPEALAEALGPHTARGPRAVAREVVRIAERAAAGAPRDDLAVLVATVTAPG
ncbi:MAG: SpoIIE family protein phosphatase [Solirubrobacteraceae bacterium]